MCAEINISFLGAEHCVPCMDLEVFCSLPSPQLINAAILQQGFYSCAWFSDLISFHMHRQQFNSGEFFMNLELGTRRLGWQRVDALKGSAVFHPT